jgi:hypothetical protein
MTTTNSPWTTFAATDTAAPAWGSQQAAQPAAVGFQTNYAQHAPQQAWSAPAQTRALPPQFDQMFAPQQAPVFPTEPRPNRTNLIVASVIAVLLLIGGGVTTFLLLNKKSDTPVKPAADVSGPQNPGPNAPVTPGPDAPKSNPVTSQPAPAGTGDLAVAQQLLTGWVALLNKGDVETAALLVCEAQQRQFIAANVGVERSIELIDVAQEGKNVSAIIQQTGQPQTGVKLTLRPTNTGYFLICDNPLSANDLAWE